MVINDVTRPTSAPIGSPQKLAALAARAAAGLPLFVEGDCRERNDPPSVRQRLRYHTRGRRRPGPRHPPRPAAQVRCGICRT
jgi:hypothetical protein